MQYALYGGACCTTCCCCCCCCAHSAGALVGAKVGDQLFTRKYGPPPDGGSAAPRLYWRSVGHVALAVLLLSCLAGPAAPLVGAAAIVLGLPVIQLLALPIALLRLERGGGRERERSHLWWIAGTSLALSLIGAALMWGLM